MDMASLPRAAQLCRDAERAVRWHPGALPAMHGEIFASGCEASGAGAALLMAQSGLEALGVQEHNLRSMLWVQDKAARRLGGRPYRAGLPEMWRRRVIHVAANDPAEALFALEEGVRCRDLACVIGEIAGNPKALDFTASRRLSLAAERHGVMLLLVRLDAAADLSSARMRWRVEAVPSVPPCWNGEAPGDPAWRAELFRARAHAPGMWVLRAEAGRLVQGPLQTVPAQSLSRSVM